MNPQQCCDFICSCTDDKCSPDDSRIVSLFKQYDINEDGFIEMKEFLEFYRISSINKADVVRQNISAHNYRPDLKKIIDFEPANVPRTALPRYNLAHN
jgi:Ca2+-binding EF-hand superfamily protein